MKKYDVLKVYCDGGSRGNPGPAASGVVFTTDDDQIIEQFGKYWGVTTNNQAEYRAVDIALDRLIDYEVGRILFYLDSELVVKQLNGEYRVKNPDLKPIYESIKAKVAGKDISFAHVYREHNKLADAQVNLCLDEQTKNMDKN